MTLTDRLDSYLSENELAAVWVARPANFAWLTGGDNVVDRDSDIGVAAAGYDGDDVTVVTNNIEAPRLRAEELDDGVEVDSVAWHESTLAEAVAERSPRPAAADFEVPGFDTVDPAGLRQPLTADQRERYRELSGAVAAAVEDVARSAESNDTEAGVAARLRAALAEKDVTAPVVLVGGAERAQQYRHYTPTSSRLGGYALLSVTAQRGGLHTSCSRTVAFDPPSWLAERTHAAARVEVTALAATRAAGRDAGTAGDVFAAIRQAYDAVGWDGEWRNHHQGGAAGFAGREWIATPESDHAVRVPQGYAWNPTVKGAKSEDTYLVSADGVELLSTTGDWPTRTVHAVGFGLSLDRPAVLRR
jgi:Xaa-Pro aminopeptidase